MRRTLLATILSMVLAAFAGCTCSYCNQGCGCNTLSPCCGQKGCEKPAAQQSSGGGTVTYPYYTIRGPRDFLETHPQSIGP